MKKEKYSILDLNFDFDQRRKNPDFSNKPRKGIMIVHRLNQKSYKIKLQSFFCVADLILSLVLLV